MKDKIVELRALGLSYRQIQKELGCSKATISHHCSPGQKEKRIERNKKYWKRDLRNKIDHFTKSKLRVKSPPPAFRVIDKYLLAEKLKCFHRGDDMDKFTMEEFLEKYNGDVRCYLTGDPIDITKPRSYQFDHIIPKTKGGKGSLDNLGVCTKLANMSKYDMNYEEYIAHCKKVVEYHEEKKLAGDSEKEGI